MTVANFVVFHPVLVVGIAYLSQLIVMLYVMHAASRVSGNHEDPYRDEGNGGMTAEDSVKLFLAEKQRRELEKLYASATA